MRFTIRSAYEYTNIASSRTEDTGHCAQKNMYVQVQKHGALALQTQSTKVTTVAGGGEDTVLALLQHNAFSQDST